MSVAACSRWQRSVILSLPKLDLQGAPAWQKERLARWMRAWEIDRDLRSAESDMPGDNASFEGRAALPVSPLSEEPPPEPGQVRLFSPELAAARDRLLYVAVLAATGDVGFTAAPCGRFPEPCVPGELLTGCETPALRVLCLWNAATIPSTTLSKSWVIHSLHGAQLAEARIVSRHIASGQALPPQLVERIGPSLWHPADPRRQYLAEERRVMESLLGGPGDSIEYPTLRPAWPIAADPHDPYGSNPDPE